MYYVPFITSLIQAMQMIFNVLSSYTATAQFYPRPATVYNGQSFDLIVVGAGSAGCVLANRLTEITNWSVLLVEAGDYPTIASDIPGYFTLQVTSPVDWNYTTQGDGTTAQSHKTHNIHETRGKGVGGSSILNYMIYVRGNKADFDRWVDLGNEGWDWDNVTYYFKKSERLNDSLLIEGETAGLHGTDGYLGITRSQFKKETNPFAEALKENGRNIHKDTNGYNQMGYSLPQYTIDNGIRQSTAVSFMRPIRNRPNLFVLTNTLVRKVIINQYKVAVGIEIKKSDGEIAYLLANKEVILSAGAINSAQLLMLSGVGPKKHLEEMSIPVVLDSPFVGHNLQDHPVVTLLMYGKKDSSPQKNPVVDAFKFPGPALVGHIAVDKRQTYPDYQTNFLIFPKGALLPTIFCSHSFKLNDEICEAVAKASNERELLNIHLTHLHPRSRGCIKLRSNNPEDNPLIYLGYFTHPADLEGYVSYVEDFLTILNTTYFKSIKASVVDMKVSSCRKHIFATRDYWRCFIRNTVTTQFHVSGTCAMGPEGRGVVDPRTRVRGIHRLRVIDGSIIPYITSGNINAPIIMIAEKAADMIKADHGVI